MPQTAKYKGCSDEQAQWGSTNDPRKVLTIGHTYDVEDIEVHSWHTRIKLVGIDGQFNSVVFEFEDV